MTKPQLERLASLLEIRIKQVQLSKKERKGKSVEEIYWLRIERLKKEHPEFFIKKEIVLPDNLPINLIRKVQL